MIIQKEINSSKLMDELLANGLITPIRTDGTSALQGNDLYISDESNLTAIQQVIDAHNPTPSPQPPTAEQRLSAMESALLTMMGL